MSADVRMRLLVQLETEGHRHRLFPLRAEERVEGERTPIERPDTCPRRIRALYRRD